MTIDIAPSRRRRLGGSQKPYVSVPPPSQTGVCNSALIAHGLGEELEDTGWEALEKEPHPYSLEGTLIHAGCRPPSVAVLRSPRLLPITCHLLCCLKIQLASQNEFLWNWTLVCHWDSEMGTDNAYCLLGKISPNFCPHFPSHRSGSRLLAHCELFMSTFTILGNIL